MRALSFLAALLLGVASADAASLPPANITTDPATTPENLQVLDQAGQWAPMGTINSTTHIFTPVGGGGGGGPITVFANHAALVAGAVVPTGSASTLYQQGFSAPGQGGTATYEWDSTSYCPAGTLGTPKPTDDIACIAPGHAAPYTSSTPGRFLIQLGPSSINVQSVGFAPSSAGHVYDNQPYVQTLMNVMNQGSGTLGIEATLPAIPRQPYTEYYFSNSFDVTRIANIHCASGVGQYFAVGLYFAPGVDGYIFDDPVLSPDSGQGGGALDGCEVSSLGGGVATVDPINTPTILSTLVYFGDRQGILPVPAFGVGDGIIAATTANAESDTAANIPLPMGTTITAVGSGTVTLSNPVTPSMGRSDAGTTLGHATFTQTGTNNFNNGDTIRVGPATSYTGPAGFTAGPSQLYTFTTTPPTNPSLNGPNLVFVGSNFAASADNLVAAINNAGTPFANYTANITGENAYTNDQWVSAARSGGVITFTSRFSGQNVNAFASVYTPTGTAAGSFGGATFSGANAAPGSPQQIYFWQLPKALAWRVRTTAGSPVITVVSGPRKLYGGDIIVSDAFKFGTTLTGPLTNANKTDPFPETITANGATIVAGTLNASVTHAPGAEGYLWVLPAGLHHRSTGIVRNTEVNNFTIGENMSCPSGGGLNCELSVHDHVWHGTNLVGRWVSGDNSNNSTSIAEEFSVSALVDVFEGSTLGSYYASINNESSENGRAKWSFLYNCGVTGTQNQSTSYSAYQSGGNAGCADNITMIPPTYGGMPQVGPTDAASNGAPYTLMNPHSTTIGGAGLNVSGGSAVYGNATCIETSMVYDIAWSYQGCATNTAMGFGWRNTGYWGVFNNTIEAMRFTWPGGAKPVPYPGYTGTKGFMAAFEDGALFGGEGNSAATNRQFEMSPTQPSNNAHQQGDFTINTTSFPGRAMGWSQTSIFTTTLTAAVTQGSSTSVTVAQCPLADPPTSPPTPIYASPGGGALPVQIANYSTTVSCSNPGGAGTLTFTGAAFASAASGATINLLVTVPVGLVPSSYPAVVTTGACVGSSLTGGLLVGGAVTGTFVAPACAGTNVIISSLPPATNSYDCHLTDRTTPADLLNQTAGGNSQTAVTIKATTAASDVVGFTCNPY